VDVVKVAHTIIVILSPGYGDAIQMLKAGIIEIGDIFVINKSDLDGADKAFQGLMSVLELGQQREGWKPPIIETVATAQKGMTELIETIERHKEYLEKTKLLYVRESKRVEYELINLVNERVYEKIKEGRTGEGENLKTIVSRVVARKLDPYSAAEKIVSALS
jgi:LAO/AO transport system kinase